VYMTPPPVSTAASAFGQSVATTFASLCAKQCPAAKFDEVALFTHLASSLSTHGVVAYNLHGTKYQVTFDGIAPFAKPKSRCELCDLLIVSFSVRAREVRMTFLQAKKSAQPLSYARNALCLRYIDPFVCNIAPHQWQLLAGRPLICGAIQSFAPPSDLLDGGLCPSIGSYGLFSPFGVGYEFLYISADMLHPRTAVEPNTVWGRRSFQPVSGAPVARMQFGCTERTYAGSLADFAAALFQLEIGAPIPNGHGGRPAEAGASQAAWLREQVATHRRAPDTTEPSQPEATLDALRDLLQPEREAATRPPQEGGKLPMLLVQVGDDQSKNP
jgi:hypothetical protein